MGRYGYPRLATDPPTGMAPAFQKLSLWTSGIVMAQWGSRQHIARTIQPFTLCGKNDVCMIRLYTERLHTLFAGTLRLLEIQKLHVVDQLMLMVTCKDCLAALTAKRLLVDEP